MPATNALRTKPIHRTAMVSTPMALAETGSSRDARSCSPTLDSLKTIATAMKNIAQSALPRR